MLLTSDHSDGENREGRRRIAYFVNTYPSISHTFIRREIEALEALGHEVTRYAIRRPDELVCPHDKADLARTSHLLPFRLWEVLFAMATSMRTPLKTFSAFRKAVEMAIASDRSFVRSMFTFPEAAVLLRRLRQREISHVHGHFGTNTTSVLRIVKALGGPTYSFTNHGPEEYDKVYNISLTEKIREASFVAGISYFGRAQLLRWTPREMWNKIEIIRCALSFPEDAAHPTPVPDTNRLLSVGRLSEEKGQLVLIHAIAQLVREQISVSLVLVGDGPFRPVLEDEIRRLGLDDVITLTGSVGGESVEILLESSRAMVSSSFAEGLPVVLMECFRAGRPAIATYVAGIVELVEPGVSGWLVPPSDQEKLADCLREVLRTPTDTLTRMGAAGYAAVRRLHNSAEEAKKLSKLFDETAVESVTQP